jgi:SAM-dependent methyltransferase
MRGRYEGAWNVVRFNWPKYAGGLIIVLLLGILAAKVNGEWRTCLLALFALGSVALLLPLLTSHLIYDRSALYRMPWLDRLPQQHPAVVLNLNAGLDEISPALQQRFGGSTLHVFDFYDPELHTEASIERARKAHAPYPGTRRVRTNALPTSTGPIDLVVAFLAIHEVRDANERLRFLTEIHRTLRPDGRLVVTEHLRDPANFLGFNVGFLHFHSKATWLEAFAASGFRVERVVRTTPFIHTFILAPQ